MPKAKLTVSGDRPEPRVFEITGETIIGRSVRADIQIEGDLVSRQHAKLWWKDGGWHFEDLGSRNGSLLNGERVATAELRHGDVLMIGYGKINFEELAGSHTTAISVSIVDAETNLTGATLADDPEEPSGATVALSYRDLVMVNQRLATISRISQQLSTILDRDELLEEVLDTLFQVFEQMDRAAIVLRDDANTFHVVATRQRGGVTTTMSVMRISASLIHFVQREGKAVLSADTAQDTRFEDRESIVGGGSRSILCAPLKAKADFLGVIYLDTDTLARPFRPNDLNLLQGIAGPMAIFLKNAELVASIEHETTLRTSLSRYLSPDIVREIGDGNLAPDLGGALVEGTVMFSDIVGFTAMSERLKPSEVVERLNTYFTSMLEAVFGWEGTVDKFGGDAILAVWGAPVANPEHQLMATAAALEMQARLFELNVALQEAGETPIAMAVGLNSGRFVAGNIGGQDRIEWTVIGDAVNLAQRVESKGFQRCVLVAASTYEGFGKKAGGYEFPPTLVKNRTEPVTIFSVRALTTPRGVTAAVPVTVRWGQSSADGVIARVHLKGRMRLSLKMAKAPDVGTEVRIECTLPEHDGTLRATGSLSASAPLLLSQNGRAVDVDVANVDPDFERVLRAEGAVPASRSLDEIHR